MKNQIIILHSCTNGNNSMYHRNNHMYIHIIYIYTCTYYINIFVFIAFYIYPPGPLSTQKNSKLGFLTSTPSFSMMACLVTGPAAKCTFGTPQPKEKTGWSGSTHLKKHARQNGIFPQIEVNIKNICETTTLENE